MEEIRMLTQLMKPEIEELLLKKEWKEVKAILASWPAPDIADLFLKLKESEKFLMFRLLPKSLQSEVFSEFDAETQQLILQRMTNEQIKTIISELDPDDRTGLFEELPGKMVQKLLTFLTPADRKESLKLLGFPENSVGRLMTPDYIAIKPEWTVRKTLQFIREHGKDAETINMIYIVDNHGHLIDDIPLRKLIIAKPKAVVETLLDHRFVAILANADQEEAVKIMNHYHLIALPVVDNENILLGIITIDDIMDVLQEEQTEDMTKFLGISPESVGTDFITRLKEVPLRKIYQSRILWLLALLFMDMITGGIIKGFEETISKYVVLVTFLPVLVDTAGNAGSQSATLVIRALALGTVEIKDWFYLLFRELAIALALGITMGLGISIMGLVRGSIEICKVVVIAMVVNVLVGCIVGVLLPFIFAKFKKDPATASTPLITTLADIFGTGIYLSIAYLMLGKI